MFLTPLFPKGPDRIEAILASARRMRGNYGMQEVQQIKRESAPYPGAQRPLSFQQPVEVGGVGSIPLYPSPLGTPQLQGLEQGFQRRQSSNPHAQVRTNRERGGCKSTFTTVLPPYRP